MAARPALVRSSRRDAGRSAAPGRGRRGRRLVAAAGRVLHRRVELPRRPAGRSSSRATPTRSLPPLEVAARAGVPLTARGGGTSIAGNAVGTGVVLDFSRHLNRVARDRPGGRTARVEPGVILDDLQRRGRAARPALRPGPVHPRPLHDRRDDRQQRLRLARAGLRPDRRQRRRASTCSPADGDRVHRSALRPAAASAPVPRPLLARRRRVDAQPRR